jgi:hypothetical protein
MQYWALEQGDRERIRCRYDQPLLEATNCSPDPQRRYCARCGMSPHAVNNIIRRPDGACNRDNSTALALHPTMTLLSRI